MKNLLASWAEVNPEQKAWMAKGLLFAGCACLWRSTLIIRPSVGLAVVGPILFVVVAIYYVKLLKATESLKQTGKWLGILLIGGTLNFAALLANGGSMPMATAQAIHGIHNGGNTFIALYWWVCLGDWILGSISPGDILMVIGFLGIAGTLIWQNRQHTLLDQP